MCVNSAIEYVILALLRFCIGGKYGEIIVTYLIITSFTDMIANILRK